METKKTAVVIRYTDYESGVPKSYTTDYAYNEYGELTGLSTYQTGGRKERTQIWEYDARGNRIKDISVNLITGRSRTIVTDYSRDNRQLKQTETDQDGNILFRTEWSYDNDGHLSSKTITSDSSQTKTFYLYYPDGKVRRETALKADGTIDTVHEYDYDSRGDQTSAAWFDENGELKSLKMYAYNELDQKTGYEQYSDGRLDYYEKYEYDDAGNLTLEVAFNENDEITAFTERKYDRYNNRIESNSYRVTVPGSDEIELNYSSSEKLTYDKDGFVLRREYYWNGELSGVSEYMVIEVKTR